MDLSNIQHLAIQLDSIRSPLGTDIYNCISNTIHYISEWEPDFVYYIETKVSNEPIKINKEEKQPTEEQLIEIVNIAIDNYTNKAILLLNSYLNYFKKDKDIIVNSIDSYVSQFSALMQLITLPNFDTTLVASLGKYNCLAYDNIFYLMDDILNKQVNWTLTNGFNFTDRVFKIYKLDTINFINYTDLNEWASYYYSTYIDYDNRPDPIEVIEYPSYTINNILDYNNSKTDVVTEVQNIINDISKTNTSIITFLTYNDFEVKNQNPTTPELNVITPPDKESLLVKVYIKHKVNEMYIYLGFPEKCMYSKEEKIKQVWAYHRSLNITRESLLHEVIKYGET